MHERKLVIDEAEAQTVRHVFRTYHELGSVRLLRAQLTAEGVTSKSGERLQHGALFHMLQNRVYRGEVVHNGNVYATRLIRLAFLAPDVVIAIMDGRQPLDLTAARLLQECRRGLPLDWQQQRAALGFR